MMRITVRNENDDLPLTIVFPWRGGWAIENPSGADSEYIGLASVGFEAACGEANEINDRLRRESAVPADKAESVIA
ncbi:MAG: hypothetical protein Q7S80_02845 [bacterium]|nr:hypothetical protein [bacterium]